MKSIFSLSFDINTRKKIPTNKNLKYGITVFSECSILTAFIKDITWTDWPTVKEVIQEIPKELMRK